MPRKAEAKPPTAEEILRYDNVPVDVACKYIGWSSPTLHYALQDQRAPFGFASQNPNTKTWTYNISPGALVRYKAGELPAYKLNEVIGLAAEGVERILNERLANLRAALGAAV